MPIHALAFDAYGTLFDVHAVIVKAEQLFPGKGRALSLLWRDKQIEYTRLITMSDPRSAGGSRYYRPFNDVTRAALRYAARRIGLDLPPSLEDSLMAEYDCLAMFPDAAPTLRSLRGLGLPLAILSNGSRGMLEAVVQHNGMAGWFDHLLSVDAVRRFKTAPEVYQLGPDAFGLPVKEILFVSANGWDAVCASWFGYTTFWVNRDGLPLEELGVLPTYSGANLNDVVAVLT